MLDKHKATMEIAAGREMWPPVTSRHITAQQKQYNSAVAAQYVITRRILQVVPNTMRKILWARDMQLLLQMRMY